ncbi:CHASE2 domain-containing protein [Hoeflea poritis]|uniref:Adenylate/guanylate cyclase domain-containing protein n=1 Tax=Hoeflea poritis TaxID=2993659 RepID=A0ABT4VRU2_9HYPH|nr:adenylate/guanylate cyclase domain-containing protein [Hoeflea poritis]MDA4847430.1 adenylate/guanylate cyclase domain-containing protein [Hoeflea poritis]
MSRTFKIGNRELRSGALGSLAAFAIVLVFLSSPQIVSDRLNQPALDAIASVWPAPASDAVAVVDIDSESLKLFEGRRLSRRRLADLVEQIVALRPAAIAFDLVLEPPCSNFDPDVNRLEQALQAAPVTSGFLLSSDTTPTPPQRSLVAIDADVRLPGAWLAPGAETSCASFLDAASGLSAASLAGDFDARIRRAPAVVAVADRPFPALAVDAVRLARKTGAVVLFGDPPHLRVGELQTRLDNAGNVHLRFSPASRQQARTVPASRILDQSAEADTLAGKIVFVGSSAAELGGLRPIPGNPLMPSVQIQADFATNLLTGSNPFVPGWAGQLSAVAALILGIGLAFFSAMMRPAAAAGSTLVIICAWLLFCALLYHVANIILGPMEPVLAIAAGAVVSSTIQFSAVRKAESVVRRRFEQRLPGAVVKKLVAEPELLKLGGEQRVATSMFTDVEGFTSLTERISPTEMVGLLDRYFEGLTGIIIAHNGMIDKTIGDGIHALFNAPVDLPDHAQEALTCAREILAFSEEFRKTGFAGEAGFGRTRIGIETGEVVLGDVGVADRVDYTAFGSSVNTAARLQDANKRYGTSILVGERAAAQISETLEDMGDIELRGIGTIRAYAIRSS